MPDIDPAALSRSDPAPTLNPGSLSLSKTNGVSIPSSTKAQKTTNAAQRIDLEPLYTNLKAAIGDHWGKYKDAISLFILGTSYPAPCGKRKVLLNMGAWQVISTKTSFLYRSTTMSAPILIRNIYTISSSLLSTGMFCEMSPTRVLRLGSPPTTSQHYSQNPWRETSRSNF